MTISAKKTEAQLRQARLQDLMTRNNSGELNPQEYEELTQRVKEYEVVTVANTEARLKAAHPELFGKTGRLILKRLDAAVRRRGRSKLSET